MIFLHRFIIFLSSFELEVNTIIFLIFVLFFNLFSKISKRVSFPNFFNTFPLSLFDEYLPGTQTSMGNAGTFAHYACIPINSEDNFKKIPFLLFSDSSPLSIQWKNLFSIYPWLIKFLQNIPANSSVFLEVKRSNLIAIKLYIDLKFIKISERKNYYHDGEDAILMHYKN